MSLRTPLLLAPLVAAFCLLPLEIGASGHAVAQSRQGSPTGTGVLLAKKAKPAKKKKADEGEAFGPDGIEAIADTDQGVGVHREQEGVDTPYVSEVAGLTELSMLKSKPKTGDGTSSTTLDIQGQFLFILGRVEVGPDIEISYQKSQVSQTVTKGTGVSATTTTETVDDTGLAYTLGGLFKFNFARIDHDLVVPFAYAGLGLRSSSDKVGDGDDVKSSGYQLKVGGGLDIFVRSGVAFVPRAEYLMINDTAKATGGGADQTIATSGLRLLFGIGVFI
jgi:hypothetical protein